MTPEQELFARASPSSHLPELDTSPAANPLTHMRYPRPGGGYSTELTSIYRLGPKGRYYIAPLLVPGQVGLDGLLQGREATPEQHTIAWRYAQQHLQALTEFFNPPNGFASPEDADAFDQLRHRALRKDEHPMSSVP